MTALVAPRKIVKQAGTSRFSLPVLAGAVILQSALVVMAGAAARAARTGQGGTDALKAADAATYRAVGVALEGVTGGSADGDVSVEVDAGAFNFVNSAGVDAITRADIGKRAFIVDDQTVARSSAGNTRAQAGIILDVTSEGVWVLVGAQISDDRRVVILPFAINETDTLAGTTAELISPVKGEIVEMSVIVQKAVTTGGDVTALVGVTAVDGLACTIADAAAKGTVVSDRPTAGHASTLVNPLDRIQVAPAAAFNTAGAVSGFVTIAY